MAVELRCPDCRAKLTLKKAPEPGAEVECPECYAVFEVPDDVGGDDDAPPPREKKRPADDEDDRPKKKKSKPKKEKAPKPGVDPKAPKKRKAKKKETNKALLTMLIVGGVLFLCLVGAMLAWYVMRKGTAHELMFYLPPDSSSVQGANIGHVRRYVELYKRFETSVNGTDFKKAGDAAAKAVGASPDEFIDYMVAGQNTKGESAIVLKAKAEFDGSQLSKLPGAKSGTANGRTFYTIDPIPGVFGDKLLKVFAPTGKIVVFCPDGVSSGTFNKMISGNDGDAEGGAQGKLGALGRQASKGTAWTVIVLDSNNRPKQPEKDKSGNITGGSAPDYEAQIATSATSAKGFALKTSVRSRHVRFEAMLQFGDSEAARNLYDKFRDSPLNKSDDASLDPPRFWKQFVQTVVGNQKVGTELYSTLSARSSGDIFILSAESETTTLMDSASGIVGKMTGGIGGGGGPMMPAGGGIQPGGVQPGGVQPGGGGGGGPGVIRGPGGGVVIP